MKKTPHIQLGYGSVLAVVSFLLFTRTDATKVASFTIIVGFVLLALCFHAVIYSVLRLVKLYGITVPHSHRLAICIAAFVSILLALQSIGELSQRDIIVLAPLIVLGYAYGAYLQAGKRTLE